MSGGSYFLVLLTAAPGAGARRPDHEAFVDSLVDRQLVLLGGPLGEGDAAYVLRCGSPEEARDVVAADPLVVSGACTAAVTPWDLVGVDLRLVDPDLVVDDG
ncbi:YciI family protein [Blastococcus sp. SYSU DS0533]